MLRFPGHARTGASLLVGAALALVTACASASPSIPPASSPATTPAPGPPGGQLKTVRVGSLPTIGNAPFLIASQRGYFAEEGLDVQLLSFSSGAEIIAPLGTGQIEAGSSITLSAGLINAIGRNVAVKVVADNGSLRPGRNIANILVRKELQPGATVIDLASLARPIRAAATAEGLLPHAIIVLQAEHAGLKIADVAMAFMGLPDMNAALKSGALDIAASGEPLITIAEQQGIATRWQELAQLYPNMPYSNVLFGPNLLQKDRDTGERLLRGYLRGVRDYEAAFTGNKDRDAIVGMLAGPLNTPAPLFQALQEAGGLAFFDPDGVVHTEALQPVLDLWVRTGLIQPGFDPSRLVDPSLASAAAARVPH